ncbi:hypothetical protein [Achromobacter phage Motura]|uniref:Uncharacterized protein n=1 Tax=Achromobacter phage Motura TaxID=2591403 RepID=A0A514CT86_9CAUD|nr:hypothetical protein H1O15_gp262 [Achromobacter phage Motura]QDH83699.1 hypothetical protein [Achromobacter phage Motura]
MSTADFRVVRNYSQREFQQDVNDLLNDGYTLHGPMITHLAGSSILYIQALVYTPPKTKTRAKAKDEE